LEELKREKMKQMRRWVPILFLLVLLMSGCNFPLLGFGSTPAPGMGSEPGISSSLILFSDNFNAGRGNWRLIGSSLGSKIAYEHQGLRITINEINFAYWTTPGKQFGDVRVVVSGSRLGGPDDNYFGVICRFQPPESYYGFLISSDGYYGIIKVLDGKFQLLGVQNMQYSDAIIQGRATNRVRGDCIGNQLTLYANGIQLISAEDSEFATGDVGLIAGSHEIWGVDILFDDFIVYQP
jgi:hypothetical protein